jgi:transcriptional regulator with XRE-family HTH domain
MQTQIFAYLLHIVYICNNKCKSGEMDLNEKIKKILESKNISPSHFADEIGIQRSSVSHILAGRNKPSLDIVQKIVRRFPELGLNWIMDEDELPVIKPESTREETIKSIERPAIVKHIKPEQSKETEPSNNQNVNGQVSTENVADAIKEKKIERVMILYSDGTFQEFKS